MAEERTVVAEADLEGGTNAAPQASADCQMRISSEKSEESTDIYSRLALNQETIMGTEACTSIAAKNNAPVSRSHREQSRGPPATSTLSTKVATQGGTGRVES